MKKVAHVIILWLTTLLLVGCSQNIKENAGEGVWVNLDISVALSDVARAESRTVAEDAEAKNENEKMQTLRVIVVRENGIVEDNRFIRLNNATELYKNISFKVVSKETKKIYLFVNEETPLKINDGDNGELLTLTDYFSNIKQGDEFPTAKISNLKVQLDDKSEQLTGALPMNEYHEVYVPDKDHKCQLFVTRAAVKFSFRITNESTSVSKLTQITISKMAREEYYLPRNAKYENEVIDNVIYRAITHYDVPDNPGYYIYEKQYSTPQELPSNKEVHLEPIYLLEGKFPENYSVGIGINGADLKGELLNLPRKLPRNTHVVVNIKLKDHQFEIIVDVEPYREAILDDVDFGL